MIYTVGICDDEISTCSELEVIIRDSFKKLGSGVEILVWNSGDSLIRDVPSKVCPDVLFLDIELPGMNGAGVGNYIREEIHNDSMHIIFISSKSSYAMELFKIHPYDFLIKPMDGERIFKILGKLIKLDLEDKRFFSYTYNKKKYNIEMSEIVYFESNRKHVKMVHKDGNVTEYVGKLSDEYLKLPAFFAMTGRSFIINIRHMKECKDDCVTMDNGAQLRISRNYRKVFNKKMMEYNMGPGLLQ